VPAHPAEAGRGGFRSPGGSRQTGGMSLPAGTVTLLFTDIESSTHLVHELEADVYVRALEAHRRLLREAVAAHEGVEVEMQGDSFHFAFADPNEAVAAAQEAQRALEEHPWEAAPIQVRIGMHTGVPLLSGNLYAGLDVHRAARVMGAGHGGQVLVSESTRALLTDRFELRDLGEHRLKDLLAPVRLYQLGEGDFPPLRSLYRTNLPVPATPFLGRHRELEELGVLLRDPATRLLTLTGPGGIGKTRLAVQTAAETAEQYEDGIFWVGLAPVREAALVTSTIAEALGAQGDLAEHIGSKRMLLVLDNLEQVVGAAPELAELLSACPGLTLLVTSRERLHVSAEREYAVPPLREPEAVALFHERARATGTEITGNGEITEICRRLDQLPLAIELAAARVKALTPRTLLERLEQRLPLLAGGPRDLPRRQQTLRSTIAWSYELLTPDEQQLFARLAVFAGGCTLDAAEHVCDAELDTLESLLDKNLLRRTSDRYWMLETIREYAAEQLDRSGRASALRQRHAEFFLALAELAEEGWRGPDQPIWLARLIAEQTNVRRALAWLESAGDFDGVLGIVGGMAGFWTTRGAWLEGVGWLRPALASTERQRTRNRARALVTGTTFTWCLGDLETARGYGEEALAIFRELGDTGSVGQALASLGVVATTQGDVEKAQRLGDESIPLLRAAGDRLTLASVANNLGYLAMGQGDHGRARPLLEESLALYRELEREDGAMAQCLFNRALLHFRSGLETEAIASAQESLGLSDRIGDVRSTIYSLVLIASLTARQGNPLAGAELLGAADAERQRLGLALEELEQALYEEARQDLRVVLGEAGAEGAIRAGRSVSLEAAVELALG
jgi:predicted ATPase/class 3 adenylate cyclase